MDAVDPVVWVVRRLIAVIRLADKNSLLGFTYFRSSTSIYPKHI